MVEVGRGARCIRQCVSCGLDGCSWNSTCDRSSDGCVVYGGDGLNGSNFYGGFSDGYGGFNGGTFYEVFSGGTCYGGFCGGYGGIYGGWGVCYVDYSEQTGREGSFDGGLCGRYDGVDGSTSACAVRHC